MDGIRVSDYLNIPYWNMTYLLRKVEGILSLKWGASQGKSRDYTPLDITRLRLALSLRDSGYKTKAIQTAINELNTYWNGESPDNAGLLMALDNDTFIWLKGDDKEALDAIKPLVKSIYDVRKVANEIYANTP